MFFVVVGVRPFSRAHIYFFYSYEYPDILRNQSYLCNQKLIVKL